ncbi:MAG TPA: hypothetical protein IAA62_02615 [Candidatus Caccopulliclostridium gallistercoris]|uniref:Uncharacterized protein n=1 Tax=Candidatus Caccopulliclostridium gallistercoris TaxID=2840719 RepID=A0A9D1NEX6_9FIRM|nr:hypothetical protein [Candidatus Caccopulliclostridium gallistercoris]
MTKAGLRYLKSPAYSQSSFRPKESEAKLKLKLMLEDIHGIGGSSYWTSSADYGSGDSVSFVEFGMVATTYADYENIAVRPALLFKL